MANDGAAPGGAPAQMPPSAFDSAMSQQNFAPQQPLIHGEPPGAGSGIKIQPPNTSSQTTKPALAHAEALPDDSGIDPNDPAELSAREALKRSEQEAQSAANAPEEIARRAETDAAAMEEWLAAKDSLTLPETFNDKLVSVPWGDKGEMRDVPISEMKEGYMRTLDHTRKNQAAAEIRRQAEQNNANMDRFLTEIQQPGQMRERLEDLGYGPVLHQVAEQIYAEKLAEERIFYDLKKKGASDEHLKFMRERFANERKLQLENRATTRQREQFRQQAQVRQNETAVQQQQQQLTNQLNQLRPASFKKLGMPDDAIHNNAFQQVFLSILQTGGGQGKQLREVVLEAATAAKQLVEEHISVARDNADQERLRAMGGGAPMSTQRLPGAAPTQGNGVSPLRNKRMGLADFDGEMARMDGGRR